VRTERGYRPDSVDAPHSPALRDGTSAPATKADLKTAAKMSLGLAVSGVLVWLTLRGEVPCLGGPPDCRVTKLAQLWTSLRAADYRWLALYLVMLAAIHLIRTVRWGLLLEPLGKPSFARLNRASAVGIMAMVLLPFRLGELARPLLIADSGKIRRSAALASVVVERVVDGIAMAAVLIVALLLSKPVTPDHRSLDLIRASGWCVFACFFALLVFCVAAYLQRQWAVRLTMKAFSPVSPQLARKLAEMLDAFIGGLKLVSDPRRIAWFALLTVLYWTVNGLGLMLVANLAFHLPLSTAGGPASIGTFQWAIIVGMGLFFPEPANAGNLVAYAWVLWGAQVAQYVSFGLFFLIQGQVPLGSLWRADRAEKEGQALA
jgi:uncharacterized protein (TIRG00374 family)